MFSVTKTYRIWFGFSGLLLILALVALLLWGLRPGIDFRGGVLLELEFEKAVSPPELRRHLLGQGFGEVTVQPVNERTLIVKTKSAAENEIAELKKTIQENFGGYQELRFESIGPTIGRELVRKAYGQVILVIFGIVLYIAYAFRKISGFSKQIKISPWLLGSATILALLHDLIIPLGLFAVLGKFKAVEIDTFFITALLTILGFSVHDTIVVFDRIRENLQKYHYQPFSTILDYSVNSTLARSINTSSTLVFVLLALLLFGGETIFYFVLTLLVGVIAGTYSSIFVASPILHLFRRS